MPSAWNYFENTMKYTAEYKDIVEVGSVEPKKVSLPKIVWISDDNIPMPILVHWVKTNSSEMTESTLDYK